MSEDELNGSKGPAPGSYNPHEIYGIERKYWREDYGEKVPFKKFLSGLKEMEKSKKEKSKEAQEKYNEMMEKLGYKNYKPQPLPLDYEMFQHRLNKLAKAKKQRQKKGLPEGKGFGAAERFEKSDDEVLQNRIKYLKSKNVENVEKKLGPNPGPGVPNPK